MLNEFEHLGRDVLKLPARNLNQGTHPSLIEIKRGLTLAIKLNAKGKVIKLEWIDQQLGCLAATTSNGITFPSINLNNVPAKAVDRIGRIQRKLLGAVINDLTGNLPALADTAIALQKADKNTLVKDIFAYGDQQAPQWTEPQQKEWQKLRQTPANKTATLPAIFHTGTIINNRISQQWNQLLQTLRPNSPYNPKLQKAIAADPTRPCYSKITFSGGQLQLWCKDSNTPSNYHHIGEFKAEGDNDGRFIPLQDRESVSYAEEAAAILLARETTYKRNNPNSLDNATCMTLRLGGSTGRQSAKITEHYLIMCDQNGKGQIRAFIKLEEIKPEDTLHILDLKRNDLGNVTVYNYQEIPGSVWNQKCQAWRTAVAEKAIELKGRPSPKEAKNGWKPTLMNGAEATPLDAVWLACHYYTSTKKALNAENKLGLENQIHPLELLLGENLELHKRTWLQGILNALTNSCWMYLISQTLNERCWQLGIQSEEQVYLPINFIAHDLSKTFSLLNPVIQMNTTPQQQKKLRIAHALGQFFGETDNLQLAYAKLKQRKLPRRTIAQERLTFVKSNPAEHFNQIFELIHPMRMAIVEHVRARGKNISYYRYTLKKWNEAFTAVKTFNITTSGYAREVMNGEATEVQAEVMTDREKKVTREAITFHINEALQQRFNNIETATFYQSYILSLRADPNTNNNTTIQPEGEQTNDNPTDKDSSTNKAENLTAATV